MRSTLAISAALLVLACCTPRKTSLSPEDVFRLDSQCADRAKSFERDWLAKYRADYGYSTFRNHYNRKLGRCLIDINPVNDVGWHETVLDATAGIDAPAVAFRSIRNGDSSTNGQNVFIDSEAGDTGKTIERNKQLMGE
jgi:hypothetical protein